VTRRTLDDRFGAALIAQRVQLAAAVQEHRSWPSAHAQAFGDWSVRAVARCTADGLGFIPLEGGKLDDVFPPGGNEDVWRRAIKAAKPKNTLEDIEASIVQHVQSTLSRSA